MRTVMVMALVMTVVPLACKSTAKREKLQEAQRLDEEQRTLDEKAKQRALERVDAKRRAAERDVGPAIAQAASDVLTGPAEPATDADRAQGKDASALLGRWRIVSLVMKTNGKGEPSQPIMPTTWTFREGGKLDIKGGMSMSVDYIYTGKALLVTGLGPKLEYEIIKLTEDELEVRATILAGDLRLENSTILRR